MTTTKTQDAKGTGFNRVQVGKGIRQIGPSRWEVQVHIDRDPITGKVRQRSRTTPGPASVRHG
jgi:hypothetical protein